MEKRRGFILVTLFVIILLGCGEKNVASTNLKNVVINGYTVNMGKNEVFGQSIPVSDVEKCLGDSYTDEIYDYSQGFRKMTYHDDVNHLKIVFVYLQTDKGSIVNWIEMEEVK